MTDLLCCIGPMHGAGLVRSGGAARTKRSCKPLLGGSTPPGGAWPTQSQLETVGGMMLEDLMHLTASLDLRAQSERCGEYDHL